MSYDVAFRHNQALDPSGCITIAATLHILEAAISDCRNAGKDIESDPAVILIARHFSSVCTDRPSEAELRKACMAQIADIRNRALGIAYRTGIAIADLAIALDRKPMSVSKYATNHGYRFGRRSRRTVTLAEILAVEPLPAVPSE